MKKVKAILKTICYIGLGSNQGNSLELLDAAASELRRNEAFELLKLSGVYRTEPQGDPEQPWFYNQVAKLGCMLSPLELLSALQSIESKLGRVRTERRFGPRSMDLDILLYGSELINVPELIVPHPRMCERAFVLIPLLELEPGLVLPDGRSAAQMLQQLDCRLAGDKIYQTL